MVAGKSSGILLLVAMVVMVAMPACMAYDMYVGGRDGWGPNPAVGYNQWAQAVRFRINDRLVFKFKNANESVLVVNKMDYDSCNVSSPIHKLDGGQSAAFRLDRSGPFYFISGVPGGCQQGQKMHIVVLSTKHDMKPPAPAMAPAPVSSTVKPPALAPTPAPLSSIAQPPVGVMSPTLPPTPAPLSSIAQPPMAGSSPVSGSPTGEELAPAPSPTSGENGQHPESAAGFVSVSGGLVAVVAMVVGGALFV